MNKRGCNTLIFMAGIVTAALLHEAWLYVRTFWVLMCNAGFGGCQ